MLLQVDVNRQGLNETVVVLRSGKRFFAAAEDLERWRIRRPAAGVLEHEGRTYYPLDALPGASFELDEARLRLAITTRAEAFEATLAALPDSRAATPAVLPQPGGFLNYSLSATHAAGAWARTGFFEAGFFSRYGVLTNSVLAPELGETARWRRLESTYTIDQPEERRSLRLGDAITRAGAWGRPVRFGGLQFATNFATQPGFIPFPVASAVGQAALPSTVDVFVNNALVARRSVPPGPFSLSNIPVVTGSGDIRVVVRDLLGREQIITQPFYGSTALLKEGLSDYSFEAGETRQDFAVLSNHYAERVAAATYRHGLTDRVTGELRAESANLARSAGASGAARVGNFGLASGSLAFSHSEAGLGRLAGFGLERNARVFSAAFQTVLTNAQFRQAGMRPGELPRRRQTIANAGVHFGEFGSLSLTHAVQEFRDQPRAEVVTLAYSLPVGRIAQLGINAVRTYGAIGGSALFTTLAIPLGELTSGSASLERTHDNQSGVTRNTPTAVVQKSLPLGDGYGYRAQVRNEDLFGSLSGQTGVGTYVLEAATARQGGSATRFGASGGVGTIAGHTFLSRSITESFAVVHVGDFENVRVLQDNQVMARTNARGYAVLPRLRAYERNPVTIEQADLPFEARLGSLRLEGAPYFRSGLLLDFPVRRVRAATLRIVLDDGSDLPSGAAARIEGQAEEFPVALRGELYLEGLEETNRVLVIWNGQTCVLDVSYGHHADPLPQLGTFICRGVKP
jgi:outer membrane usher protein